MSVDGSRRALAAARRNGKVDLLWMTTTTATPEWPSTLQWSRCAASMLAAPKVTQHPFLMPPIAPGPTLESIEPFPAKSAQKLSGKEVSIDDTGAPCVCNKVETSEVVQHKCVPITNVLEAYGCRSRRIQRTRRRGQWIWYRKTQRTAPGNRRSRKYLRDASTVIGHESFRKFAKQLRNFRPGIPACTTVQQSRVVAYSARNYWCIRYWKSNQY